MFRRRWGVVSSSEQLQASSSDATSFPPVLVNTRAPALFGGTCVFRNAFSPAELRQMLVA